MPNLLPSESDTAAPDLTYFGSKTQMGVRQRIIAHMCEHELFIETHWGTGAVGRDKPPSAYNYGCEINPETIARFEHLVPEHFSLFEGDWKVLVPELVDRHMSELTGLDRVLLYHDSPYHPDTRTSRDTYGEFDYDHDKMCEFLETCAHLPYRQMISGYNHPVYDQFIAGWRRIDYQVATRRSVKTESLWLNYPASKPFWHKFAGRDAEHRVALRRKGARWRKKYLAMPDDERLVILQWLLNEEN